jgi:hypothetical protein
MRWVPTTDIEMAAQALVDGLSLDGEDPLCLRIQGYQVTDDVRLGFLERFLPVPVEPVPVDSILSFRRKHGDLLPDLRRYLENEFDAVLTIGDPSLRQRHLDRLEDEMDQRLEQARAYMNETLQRRVGSSKLLRWAKAVPVVGNTAGAVQDVAESLVTQGEFETEPLAYLAFAHLEFGPRSSSQCSLWSAAAPPEQ